MGLSDADWLAIDDLTVWADPDGLIDPREGDCGAPNCDLLSDGPIDVDVSQRHLHLSSEGWPSPNPIIVTMTVDLDERDTLGLWRGGYLQLSIKNLYDGPTRVFAVPWNGESPGRFKLGREESVDVLRDGSFDYYDAAGAYHYLIPFRIFPPYGTHEQYFWQIWVQPSDAAKLEIKAELLYNEGYPVTDPPNLWDRACVQAPQAQIHPVVFVHGILGSMPPGDHVWAEHPPLNWDILGRPSPTLDPFARSYYPLLQNLEKMGYEWGKTLHAVTYDWRNDNSVSGGYLASQLPGIIEAAAGVPYVWRDGRADVVVHSMGGLVTRAYVEDKTHQPYANDLNRAVFIASPHEGFAATYDTWEGMTWRDYLDEGVLWGADLTLMTELMDNILWPAIVIERYRPSFAEFATCKASSDILQVPLEPICLPETIYAWSHAEGPRGVQSLPQMLPTQDLIAAYGRYLVDVNDPGAELPYEVNTWLADLNDDVGLLDGRLGDIFVVYGDGRETVINYVVEPPPQGYQGMWQYGAKIRDFKPTVGDNLIPVQSADLEQVGAGPSIHDKHEYDEEDAGHKALPFKTEVQQDVGGFLGGYRNEEEIAGIPFFTPYNSTIAPGNLGRVIFLALRLMPPYPPGNLDVGMSGGQILTDSQGRRLGYDPTRDQIINEIPGAYLMGSDDFGARFFMLTDPIEGNYTLTASRVATYTESYAVSVHDLYLDGAGGVRGHVLASFTTTLTTGQVVTSPLFIPSLGAVGQWRLDEVSGTLAYDSSGYGHHGRLVGGPTWASGHQGSGLHLDGLDDHVWISDSAHLDVSGTLTLEAWVHPESVAGERVLLSRWGDGPGQRAYKLTLDEGRLRAYLSGDGVNAVDLGASTLTVTAGNWQHLALVYDGTSAYYYVDGVGQETPVAPPVGSIFSSDSPLFLGRSTSGDSAALPFAGLLDEVQVSDVARDDLTAWQQTDWSGGPGQAIWNNDAPARYATATGIDESDSGEIRLTGVTFSGATTYSATGVLTSSVFDGGQPLAWAQVSWEVEQPSGTEVELTIATSDDGANWSDWTTLESSTSGSHYQADLSQMLPARYLYYRVILTADPWQSASPALRDVAFRAYLPPGE